MKPHLSAWLLVCVLTTLSVAQTRPAEAREIGAGEARAFFERLKQLEGKWLAKSTKGWDAATQYQTIAGGSVVHEVTFGAHPNEYMVNMFFMDGDRLKLTHYCVSGNQPTLVAHSVRPDGTVVFTFDSATNLPSRDKGHMDKVVMRLVSGSETVTQWTWYQKGQERWLEEIHLRRERTSGEGGRQ